MRKIEGQRAHVAIVTLGASVLAALIVGVVVMRDAATHRTPSGLGGRRTEFQVGLILVMAVSALIIFAFGRWLRSRRR